MRWGATAATTPLRATSRAVRAGYARSHAGGARIRSLAPLAAAADAAAATARRYLRESCAKPHATYSTAATTRRTVSNGTTTRRHTRTSWEGGNGRVGPRGELSTVRLRRSTHATKSHVGASACAAVSAKGRGQTARSAARRARRSASASATWRATANAAVAEGYARARGWRGWRAARVEATRARSKRTSGLAEAWTRSAQKIAQVTRAPTNQRAAWSRNSAKSTTSRRASVMVAEARRVVARKKATARKKPRKKPSRVTLPRFFRLVGGTVGPLFGSDETKAPQP